jgi:microcystin-dependent protein
MSRSRTLANAVSNGGILQPGDVAFFAMSTAPNGWLKANGALVSRTTYAALFAAIGTTYGAGDGSTTFALPDLRGEFLRGLDDGRGVDSGRGMGTAQAQAIQSHTHTVNSGSGQVTDYGGNLATTNNFVTAPATSAAGGTETRPRNVALLACIKT